MTGADRPTTARTRPRPQLDRDTILDAVLRLAARPGTEAVTVRLLGRELGADPTAIYRHFTDKEALVRGALDRLFGQVSAAMPTDLDWRGRLRWVALETLDVLLAHPAVGAQAGMLTTSGEHELEAVEMMLEAFREAGLGDPEAVRYYATFSSYVLAFSGAQASSRLEYGEGGDPSAMWLADYSEVDATQHPAVAALQPTLGGLQDRDVFMTGVDIILESAASRAGLAAPTVSATRTKGSSGR